MHINLSGNIEPLSDESRLKILKGQLAIKWYEYVVEGKIDLTQYEQIKGNIEKRILEIEKLIA